MKLYSKLKALLMFTAVAGIIFATPYAASAESGKDLLHRGMTNSGVEDLQDQLKDFHYYDYKVDSIFGPITYKAVSEFQKDYGLAADGIAGPNTFDTLNRVVSLNHTYEKAPLLGPGDRGEIVEDLQTQLQNLNYYDGEIDGIYGSLTEEAVKDFQRDNDIAVDGIAGPDTYAALIKNPVRNKESANTETVSNHEKVSASESSSSEKKVKSASTSPKEEKKSEETANVGRSADKESVRTFYVESTAYTAYCPGCSGITATGINLIENPKAKVIAVDPDVIPLGSTVWVEGYGYAIAGDTGGAINGMRIDVFIPNHAKAMHWGRRKVKVKVFE